VRLRLVAVTVAIVAFVLAIHDIPLAAHLERVERDRLVTKYERDAFIIGGRSEEALDAGVAAEEPALRALAIRYAAEESVEVVIVDATARAVISSEEDRVAEDMSNRPEIVAALTSGAPQTGERFSETLGTDLFFVAVPVLSGTERVGAVRISVLGQVVADRVSARLSGLLFVALLSLVVASLVSWLLARTLTRPLRRLESTTEDLASGNLAARADAGDGPPEAKSLAASINVMADQIEGLLERQRAFAGTASHQLRTPLTALRLRLEQLAIDVAGNDGLAGRVESALDETDRLRRIIEGLLALSRAEGSSADVESIDIGSVVRERAEHWRPLADERAVAIVDHVRTARDVLAVPGGVEQIVDNLVDNALEVSPPGTSLTLAVVDRGDTIELHVADEGPGLAPADRQRAFDRFWRAADAPAGGSGLGLAIVRELAVAGGGAAEMGESPSGGVDVVVTFRVGDVRSPRSPR
jgi:signal transduction histidine kinase